MRCDGMELAGWRELEVQLYPDGGGGEPKVRLLRPIARLKVNHCRVGGLVRLTLDELKGRAAWLQAGRGHRLCPRREFSGAVR